MSLQELQVPLKLPLLEAPKKEMEESLERTRTRSSSREVRTSWYQLFFFFVYFSKGTLPKKRVLLGDLARTAPLRRDFLTPRSPGAFSSGLGSSFGGSGGFGFGSLRGGSGEKKRNALQARVIRDGVTPSSVLNGKAILWMVLKSKNRTTQLGK